MTDLAAQVVKGDRRALAKAITLLESRLPADRIGAEALLQTLLPKSGGALRLGVSGPPGVGKSTFIEALGKTIVKQGRRVAVLAVDPTSEISGGSILGDRVRMEELSKEPQVFIRASPSGLALGGVARRTREAILACEAAGYDVVLVETVGVGQSETVVASMVDAFLMLHQPHSGDEFQAMKKGILELADLVAVTKADGPLLQEAGVAKLQLEQSLGGADGRSVPVLTVSSLEDRGVLEVWNSVLALAAERRTKGTFAARRADQALAWFRSEIDEGLRERFAARPEYAPLLAKAEAAVRAGHVAASVAASQFLDAALRRS